MDHVRCPPHGASQPSLDCLLDELHYTSDEQAMSTLSSHRAFLADTLSRQSARRNLIDPTYSYIPQPEIRGYTLPINAEAGPSKRNVPNYVSEEETIRNDLTERYIQSGEFGSNYIQGAEDDEICEE